jgi:hypothetical protein
VLAVCVVAVVSITAVLLTPSDRDAREVADDVVEALADGDTEDYASLLCPGDDDPAAAIPPILSKKELTVSLRGLRHYPGENRPDGQVGHYRATVAVEETDTELVLLIDEEDGSWCLLQAFVCPEVIEDEYASPAAVFCSDRPHRIEP